MVPQHVTPFQKASRGSVSNVFKLSWTSLDRKGSSLHALFQFGPHGNHHCTFTPNKKRQSPGVCPTQAAPSEGLAAHQRQSPFQALESGIFEKNGVPRPTWPNWPNWPYHLILPNVVQNSKKSDKSDITEWRVWCRSARWDGGSSSRLSRWTNKSPSKAAAFRNPQPGGVAQPNELFQKKWLETNPIKVLLNLYQI